MSAAAGAAEALAGLALFAAVAAGAPEARGARAESIRISEVRVLGGEDGADERLRAPVLVRDGFRLLLHYRSPEGDFVRGWREGVVLGEPAAVVASTDARRWVEVSPDELDLRELPEPGVRVSSSCWRNGRLFDGGEPVGWCPSLAVEPSGARHLVFDRLDRGDYDVLYRGPDGVERRLAGSRKFEADATVAADERGRVFVAWDEGAEGFGHGDALHRERHLRLAVLSEDGLAPLAPPGDLLEGALGRASEGFSMVELPRLVVDDAGVLWLFVKAMARWNRVEAGGERGEPDTGSNRRVVWEWRVAALSDATEGWTETVTLPQSDGGGYDGLAAVPLPGRGLAVAYETDGRMRRFPRTGPWEESLGGASRLVAVELSVGGGPAELELGEPRPFGRTEPATPPVALDPDPELVPEGRLRLWGDLHRHSDLSRCKMDEDGNQLAQYRYAIDVGRLGFVGLSEHYQHLSRGHWDYAREMAERFYRPGELVTLFGFEQAQTDGHRNLFTIDPEEAVDAPFRAFAPRRRWLAYPPSEWIAIPHQLADPKVPLQWPVQRGAIETLVEVFQSRRGSYFSEDDYLRSFHALRGQPRAVDYLRDGKRFGVVAASDHVTTGGAYTAVLVNEATREDVFDALKSRRTYAATTKMAVDVRLENLDMGAVGPVDRDASLSVRVAAGAELARVEVLRGGVPAVVWAGTGEERWLTVRLGGGSRDARLLLRLEDAEWVGAPRPFRDTPAASILSTESGVLVQGELGAYGECGVVARVRLGEHAALHLERERVSETVPLVGVGAAELGAAVPMRVGPVRCEVRLDPEPLGSDRLDRVWQPGDWKSGEWVMVRVIRTDGEMAWTSPIVMREVRE